MLNQHNVVQILILFFFPSSCAPKSIHIYSFKVLYAVTQDRAPIKFPWTSGSKFSLRNLRELCNLGKSYPSLFLLPASPEARFSELLAGHPGFSYSINDSKAEFWSDALFRRRPFIFKESLEDYQVFPIAVSSKIYGTYRSTVRTLYNWLKKCKTNIQSYCFLRFDGYTPLEIADQFYSSYYGRWLGNSKWKIHNMEWKQLGSLFLPFLEWSRLLNVRKFERKERNDAFLKDEVYFGKLYLMWLCVKWGKKYDYDQIMPDPCKNPRAPSNAIRETCQSHGCFANDVSYACRGGTLWNAAKYRCEAKARPCTNKEWKWYCVAETTEKCLVDQSQSLFVMCHCKKNFGKFNCALRLNACNYTKNADSPPGDFACGKHLGNDCIPRGSSSYSCKCSSRWTMDTSLPYPNCFTQVPPDPCLKLSCRNGGSCKPLPGRPHLASCVCPSSHFGTLCDFAYSTWDPWAEWQSCIPSCGATRRQLRWRSCSGSTPCAGPMVERRRCSEVACPPGQEEEGPRDEAPSEQWRISIGSRIAILLVKVMFAELGISAALALLRFLWRWGWAKKMAQLQTSIPAETEQVESDGEESEASAWMQLEDDKKKK